MMRLSIWIFCCYIWLSGQLWAQGLDLRLDKQSVVRILGDVNADGLANISDALIVATYGLDTTIAVPNNGDIRLGDVNADGLVNVSDALIIATFGVNPSHVGLPSGIGQTVVDTVVVSLPDTTQNSTPDTTVAQPPVVDVNFAPVMPSPGVHVVPVGIPFSLPVTATDPDGDVLAFAVANAPVGAVFANRVLQWTPTFEQRGEYDLVFSADDGKGGTAQASATLAVVDFNFLMRRFFIETRLPSFVNLIFQVTDAEGRGVDHLEKGHFEVKENNQPISSTESALEVRQLDAVSHRLQTVLVLDNSASIGNDLEQVKNAAIALVQNVRPQQQFAIYEFSERPVLLQDFTSDAALLTRAIQGIGPGLPTTNLYGAVIEGLTRWNDVFSLEEIQQGFLIVFTDGRDTQGLQTQQQVLFERSGKRVYTIGLGNEVDPSVLGEIGNAGFFQIQDVNQLADRFARIQDHIALSARGFYNLSYLSPTRGERSQQLQVVVRNNKNRSHLNEPFLSSGFYSVRRGVHINSSREFPEGIDSLIVSIGDMRTLQATTFLGQETPQYTWQIADDQTITLTVDPQDQALARIEVKGNQPPSTTITISDVANDLQRVVSVDVFRSTQDTLVRLPSGDMMEMVFIEPGTFRMGSENGDADELPVHNVTLERGYYLGKFEVAQYQWEGVMGTRPWQGRQGVVVDSLHPASHVSWQDAQEFIQKLNEFEGQALYRLPTEAEWEYACRAGTQTEWAFGNSSSQLGNYAWFVNNAWLQDERYGHKIGTKLPNAWRLFDMHGNMMEWCHDWYASNYLNEDQKDPQGPTSGQGRVVRGGCFACSLDRTRSADRHFTDPNNRSDVIGFRVLRRLP